jgi:Kef-type K+ transport system membrane component KefB
VLGALPAVASGKPTVVIGLSTLFAVCVVTAIVPLLSYLLPDRPPQVVLLLLGGIVIGPSGLNVAHPDQIELLSNLGLGFLFLFAGYEIEPRILRSSWGQRSIYAWITSLGIAVGAVTVLYETNFVSAPVPIAIGLTTTALGTLLPMMRERGVGGDLRHAVLANGAVGELLPVLAIALVLGAYNSWIELLAVIGISALGWCLIVLARRSHGTRVHQLVLKTAHGTGQTALRWTMVILVGLLLITSHFGIDSVLGAFLAGFVLRNWAGDDVEMHVEAKLDIIGYGLFIPLFFVVSGMSLDVKSIEQQPARLLLFFALLLVTRGLPTLLFFSRLLSGRERLQLMFLTSTTLPLLVAVTTVGVQDGHMRPENAAALVGAGMVSVALCPFIGIRLLGRGTPTAPDDLDLRPDEADLRDVIPRPTAAPDVPVDPTAPT